MSPLLNPPFGSFRNARGHTANFFNPRPLEPVWALYGALRKVTYKRGSHIARCYIISSAFIASSNSRNISSCPRCKKAICCAIGFARSGKNPIQRGNLSIQAAQHASHFVSDTPLISDAPCTNRGRSAQITSEGTSVIFSSIQTYTPDMSASTENTVGRFRARPLIFFRNLLCERLVRSLPPPRSRVLRICLITETQGPNEFVGLEVARAQARNSGGVQPWSNIAKATRSDAYSRKIEPHERTK